MIKTYKITEAQFKEIKEHQQHWEWFDDFQHYLDEHEDDLMFYDFLSKDFTGLNNGMYIDGSISYIAYDHPLWVYVVDNDENLVPFSVSRIPQILVNTKNYKVDLTDEDISSIKAYIIKHYRAIFDYAKMKINSKMFIDYVNRCEILESMVLTEMPVFKPNETGLPVDIWVDGERTTQHGSRIKFQSCDDKSTRSWSTCTISDNPQIKNLPNNSHLNNKDLQKVINFVIYNKNLLLSLANDFSGKFKDEDILKRMIKIGKHGGPIYSKEMFDEPMSSIVNNALINIFVEVREHELYFIADRNDEQTKKLMDTISQSNDFNKVLPYSVVYASPKHYENGMLQWGSKMIAISQFKDIATANGFNVKIINK